MRHSLLFLLPLCAVPLCAQEKGDPQVLMMQVLQRMDALEQENRELIQEVRALRQELDASKSPASAAVTTTPQQSRASTLQDQVTVDEHRIAEQAQTKVEASQKFPISLNGMLLFNAFANSAGPAPEDTGEYGLLAGPGGSGATVRQTLLGFQFQGPTLPGGGRVNGSLMMDFWGGSSVPTEGWLRLRQAGVSLDWKNRSVFVGQDKPLISPYQPDSLAEVAIPPLAGSGNLWLWLPQARYEERFGLGSSSGLTGQLAVMQTGETYQYVPSAYSNSLQPARAALEGRLAFWHKFDDVRRFELGSGFHTGSTHVAGSSAPSRVATLDWRIVPLSKVEVSGTIYTGENVAGLGALGNGFTILDNGIVRAVNSSGGWAQLSVPITKRLKWNLFSGIENDHAPYLGNYAIVHELSYASNLIYHLGPNVLLGLEALQLRTRSFSGTTEIHNHYDVALGYLF